MTPIRSEQPGLPLRWGICLLALAGGLSHAGDWPCYRANAQRTAATQQALPAQLHLQWSRQLPSSQPAWQDPRLGFDRACEPVVYGKTLVLGSNRRDSVTAFDTASGAERWRFYAEGPVRFAPVLWDGKAYVASDDGFVYCLSLSDGHLLWKFAGAPQERRVLGNGRLISAWPIRGGPVLADGRLYLVAGMWPFMGVFVYCLDPATGAVVWSRDDASVLYQTQAHASGGFGGLAAQGYLVAEGNRLIVATGRAWPACLDRETGAFLYHHIGWNSGDSAVCAGDGIFVSGGIVFDSATGDPGFLIESEGQRLESGYALTADTLYAAGGGRLMQCRVAGLKVPPLDAEKRRYAQPGWMKSGRVLAAVPVGTGIPATRVFLAAGPRIYAARDSDMVAVDAASGEIAWQHSLPGRAATAIAADDRLFVVTEQGLLLCFGQETGQPAVIAAPAPAAAPQDEAARAAAAILEDTGVREGYAVVLGLDDGCVAEELARQSALRIVAVDANAERVAEVRRRLDDAALYGDRIAVHVADPLTFRLPPYLASLIVTDEAVTRALCAAGNPDAKTGASPLAALFEALRPYGGTLACRSAAEDRAPLQTALASQSLPRPVEPGDARLTCVRRDGALPGSADWTHENADAGNTAFAADQRVKPPFAILYFGDTEGQQPFFDRHTQPTREQIAAGRMVIEGPDKLTAVDIYTGRLLWERAIYGLGQPFEGWTFQRGAKTIGANYVTLDDSVYVNTGTSCLRLDPATGETLAEFRLPLPEGEAAPPWAFLTAWKNVLLASTALDIVGDDFFALDFKGFPPDWIPAAAVFVDRLDPSIRLPREAGEADASYVARNFTKMLDDPQLLSRIPEGELGRTSAGLLSGGAWLQGQQAPPDAPRHAKYRVSVPASGKYQLWVRKFYHHGPFRWRFDNQPWRTCDNQVPFADGKGTVLWKNLCANWKLLGEVELAEGARTFDAEVLENAGQAGAAAFDCFVLASEAFVPRAASKPASGVFVWWEGEDAVEHNFPSDDAFAPANPMHRAALNALKQEYARLRTEELAPGSEALRGFNRRVLDAFHPILPVSLPSKKIGKHAWSGSISRQLVAMDRFTGRPLWQRRAERSFRHNAVVIGGGKVFCVDRVPDDVMASLRRRGEPPAHEGRLLALDANTGTEVWSATNALSTGWLSYSETHDVLVEAVDPAIGGGEMGILRARRGADGRELWRQRVTGLCALRGDTVVVDGRYAFGLLDGKPRNWTLPPSTKGCGMFLIGEHIVTFRSATTAYFDVDTNSGTYGLGGFRLGCSDNAVPAGGVLNIPNLAAGCSCNYPIQTSVALVHDPDVEQWSWGAARPTGNPPRLGLNLGAPGDRMSDEGTLWLDYPSVGGASPAVSVSTTPDRPRWFRMHSVRLEGNGLKWVAASGGTGLRTLSVSLGAGNTPPAPRTVRLYFTEPDSDAGQRVFRVLLQGREVLPSLDVAAESGGRLRPLVKEFRDVLVADTLKVDLEPIVGEPVLCGVEIL